MKSSVIRKELKEVQKDLAALRGDLPKIKRLLEQHRGAVTAAKAEGKSFEELAELQAKADTFGSVLAQHQNDITETQARARDLEAKLAKQSAGERLAEATREHDALQTDYRDALRAAIDTLQAGLRKVKVKRDGLEDLRGEIEGLALTLDLKRPSFVRLDMYADGFKRLLFDETWPSLGASDNTILGVVGALTASRGGDPTVLSGDSRQTIGRRKGEHKAHLLAGQEEHRRQTRAKLLESMRQREAMGETTPAEREQLQRLEAQQ